MVNIPETNLTVFQYWSRAVAGLLEWQWRMLGVPCQAGQPVLEETMEVPPVRATISGPVDPDQVRRLEQQALDLAAGGQVPPKEIYAAPFRDRIDWLRFPAWARPSDPEMFQDCTHEG
jgi:hypothetical protein